MQVRRGREHLERLDAVLAQGRAERRDVPLGEVAAGQHDDVRRARVDGDAVQRREVGRTGLVAQEHDGARAREVRDEPR